MRRATRRCGSARAGGTAYFVVEPHMGNQHTSCHLGILPGALLLVPGPPLALPPPPPPPPPVLLSGVLLLIAVLVGGHRTWAVLAMRRTSPISCSTDLYEQMSRVAPCGCGRRRDRPRWRRPRGSHLWRGVTWSTWHGAHRTRKSTASRQCGSESAGERGHSGGTKWDVAT